MQLTDQVQRINTKLQDSLTTLSQPSPSAGPPPAAANGNSSSGADAAAGGADATAPRGKIDKMSAEVVDSNPYSRLMALQRMGIVQDYEKIRQKTVSTV
jgi:ubiquitin-like modifier-activating enzyme 5